MCLITYNHEPYIGKAVEGVLEQRTAFDFEVIVGDDGSTDRTRRLLEALCSRDPRRLTLLPSSAKLGGPRNLARTLAACRGQYVALLEGDDYWTSPAKLQRQADFLDGRQDCAMVFHNVQVLEEPPTGDHPAPGREPEVTRLRRQLARQAAAGRDTLTLDTLLRECVVPTGSVMFRRASCPTIPDWYLTLAIGDWLLHALTAEHGDVGYINEVLSVYRIHDQGLSWSRSPVQRGLDAIDACQYVDAHLGGRYPVAQQQLTLLHLRSRSSTTVRVTTERRSSTRDGPSAWPRGARR